jgi:ABC-type polysaccharide/polyol phosphate export systems, permease component
MSATFYSRQARTIGALMMRELITRYGRRGLGFLWLVGEPLIFCVGVLAMWNLIRPDYEHGLRIGPFLMTGYMSLVLMRHQISYSLAAVQSNMGLLHHRDISVLHLYIARNLLEIAGATVALAIVYVCLYLLGQVSWPHDLLLLYAGWGLLAFLGFGTALVFSGLAIRFDVMERVVPLLTYLLIPLSGVFFMAAWIPSEYRELYLRVPFPHPIEMIRAAVFGPFVETHYDALYALVWAVLLTIAGLLLLVDARARVEAE